MMFSNYLPNHFITDELYQIVEINHNSQEYSIKERKFCQYNCNFTSAKENNAQAEILFSL